MGFRAVSLLGVVLLCAGVIRAMAMEPGQHTTTLQPEVTAPHRTRLVLKDGSYQVVMGYRVVGKVVRYISAERGGAEEEVPVALVDFEATKRWERQHAQPADGTTAEGGTESGTEMGAGGAGAQRESGIDPELLKEEEERAALTPEVAKDLRLPEEDSTLVLDTFRSVPELVPLAQTDSDLNRNTAHNVLRAGINPLSSAHDIVTLKGESSPVQLHVKDPVFYIRVDNAAAGETGGPALTVDTHGATANAQNNTGVGSGGAGGSPKSRYVVVRAEVRTGARVIASFRIGLLGRGERQPDVVECASELLPGGDWLKITPKEPLDFGEFALMEVISDKAVNLGVWDFGVHPVAPENRDVLKPEPRKPVTLERRRPE